MGKMISRALFSLAVGALFLSLSPQNAITPHSENYLSLAFLLVVVYCDTRFSIAEGKAAYNKSNVALGVFSLVLSTAALTIGLRRILSGFTSNNWSITYWLLVFALTYPLVESKAKRRHSALETSYFNWMRGILYFTRIVLLMASSVLHIEFLKQIPVTEAVVTTLAIEKLADFLGSKTNMRRG